MSYKRYLITVTDNLSATSMPFNEFVLYRKTRYPDEKQIVFLLFKTKADDSVEVPEDVDVYYIGKDRNLLTRITNKLDNDANKIGVPIVFHIHEAKSVILFNIATKFRYFDKIVYTLHSTYKNYPFHNKVFSACASLMFKEVVCVSMTSLKYYPWYLKVLRKRHVRSIQNGVDLDKIDKAVVPSDSSNGEVLTLICVARLIPLKRHKILIDALSSCNGARLVLVGIGPLEKELKDYVKNKGVEDRVEFKGLMPRQKVFEQLKLADVYVSASSYEGLPVGVLEAMGCGLPCVVSDIEQHREIKESIGTLILCDEDPRNWADRISLIRQMPKENVILIGENNRKKVKEHFSLEMMHSQYNEVYKFQMQT